MRLLRRLGAGLLALVAVAIGLLLLATPASAHAVVVSSDPADGARLNSAPASVSIRFDEPVGLESMSTDEGKVSQVLRNFISNALKFTERGEVRVSPISDTDADVVIRLIL